MRLHSLELCSFKSFCGKTTLTFDAPVTAIVGPNGSGKSNVCDALRFVLGEQSARALRAGRGEDLIFHGTPGVATHHRARVALVFDNQSQKGERLLPIDFDEVTIERVVHRDGANDYFLNGSKVRLKDIVRLLAHARIGLSGYQMISQGQADRILYASSVEKREMLESAWGLDVFHIEKEESARKLAKTEENLREADLVRRELAPRLALLAREAKKAGRIETWRKQLAQNFHDYYMRERRMAYVERLRLEEKEKTLARTRAGFMATKGGAETNKDRLEKWQSAREKIARSLGVLRSRSRASAREMGRLEGVWESGKKRTTESQEEAPEGKRASGNRSMVAVSISELNMLVQAVDEEVAHASRADSEPERASRALQAVVELLRSFRNSLIESAQTELDRATVVRHAQDAIVTDDMQHVRDALARARENMRTLAREEERLEEELRESDERIKAEEKVLQESAEKNRAAHDDIGRDAQECGEMRASLAARETAVEHFAEEVWTHLGRDFLFSRVGGKEIAEETSAEWERDTNAFHRAQETRRRDIERLMVRIEEYSDIDAQKVLRDYEDAQGRDAYLAREMADLIAGRESLSHIVANLDRHLTHEFHRGLDAMNREFQEFFSILFGGGRARLSLAPSTVSPANDNQGENKIPSAAVNQGIEIEIAIPGKKIKSIDALSGGEKTLVSIALIFALSQVNPPPFLILDETDAALDEVNSRRYGEMIRRLAERSQIILITHNRETMSYAGILYGVTMHGSGMSKLLSVRFNDTEKTPARMPASLVASGV